jgi:hypothetical protein
VEKILQRISALQKEGGLKPPDLLLAFLVAPPAPLAQDVLPRIGQGSNSSLLQGAVSD